MFIKAALISLLYQVGSSLQLEAERSGRRRIYTNRMSRAYEEDDRNVINCQYNSYRSDKITEDVDANIWLYQFLGPAGTAESLRVFIDLQDLRLQSTDITVTLNEARMRNTCESISNSS